MHWGRCRAIFCDLAAHAGLRGVEDARYLSSEIERRAQFWLYQVRLLLVVDRDHPGGRYLVD